MIIKNITLLLLAFSTACFADYQITQKQFIDKVLAQEKLLAQAQIGLDIKQIEKNASRDNYQNWALNLSANAYYNYFKIKRKTDSTSSYIGKNKGYPRSVGVSAGKRFLNHRGNVKIGVKKINDRDAVSTYKKSIYTSDYHTREVGNLQFIRYSYPLLKHDGNAASLKTYHSDIVDLKRQKLLFFETKEDLLVKQLSNYFTWIELHNSQSIQRNLLDDLNAITTHNDKDKVVLKKTKFKTEIGLKDTSQRLKSLKIKISILLDDESILSTTPNANLSFKADIIKPYEVDKFLQKYNRDLERIRLELVLKEINIKYYKNRSLPTLNFLIEAINTTNKRNTKSSMFDDKRIGYKAGLEFSMPFGVDISNAATLKKERLGVKRLQISLSDKRQDILADVKELGVLLVVNENELVQNIENSKQSLILEKRSYDAKKSSMRDLIIAYEESAQAKLLKLSTLAGYQIRRVKYQALLDRLVVMGCADGLAACVY